MDYIQYGFMVFGIGGIIGFMTWMQKRTINQNKEWFRDKIEDLKGSECSGHSNCFDKINQCNSGIKKEINKIREDLSVMQANVSAIERTHETNSAQVRESIIAIFKSMEAIKVAIGKFEQSLFDLKDRVH